MGVVIGLIGGSGLLKSKLPALLALREEVVDTAHGRVVLRCGPLTDNATLVFIQRHDARVSREYTQPAEINYAAIALALLSKVGTGSECIRTDFVLWCGPHAFANVLAPSAARHLRHCDLLGWES